MNRIILFLLLFTSPLQAATVYCKSGAAGAADGSTWADAYTTLAAALTAAGAGGTVYVSQAHNEATGAAVTLTAPGTASAWTKVICVDDSAEPPTTLATTGIVSTNTGSISFAGFAYVYGVTFTVSQNSNIALQWISGSPWAWRLKDCKLRAATAHGSSSKVICGGSGNTVDDQLLILENTTVEFGSAVHSIVVLAPMEWINTPSAIVSGTLPTSLFGFSAGGGASLSCRGVDFSALGSGKNLFSVAVPSYGDYTLENCKLGASVALYTGTYSGAGSQRLRLLNCDSGDTNTRYALACGQGEITSETTIVRSTGASDGTTTVSRKMVSNASASFYSPLCSDWMHFWNETTGSNVTVTIPIITDNVTLKDGEAWLEVEHLGTSGFPIASFATDKGGDVLTPGTTNQTTDAVSSWTTTGLGTPVKQELSVTVTPQEKGLIRARVCLAKASTTMYFDPEALQTAGRSYMTQTGVTNEAAQTGGSPATTVTPYVGP